MRVPVEARPTILSFMHTFYFLCRMDQLPSLPTPVPMVIGVAQSMKFNQEAHSKQLLCQMHHGKEL